MLDNGVVQPPCWRGRCSEGDIPLFVALGDDAGPIFVKFEAVQPGVRQF